MSSDENFKLLHPAMPEVFYSGLFNFLNLYIFFLLKSMFYFIFCNLLEKEIQISLWKVGNVKLVILEN